VDISVRSNTTILSPNKPPFFFSPREFILVYSALGHIPRKGASHCGASIRGSLVRFGKRTRGGIVTVRTVQQAEEVLPSDATK
jgi:hypothetical protein